MLTHFIDDISSDVRTLSLSSICVCLRVCKCMSVYVCVCKCMRVYICVLKRDERVCVYKNFVLIHPN